MYDEKNIEILEDEEENGVGERREADLKNTSRNKILVYSFKRKRHIPKCQKMTEILTYIKYDDGSDEDLVYPWDKKRLDENQTLENIMAHMADSHIEYYPIKVLGSDDKLDKIMLKMFPQRISMQYSGKQKRKYPMNVCQYCGAKQGQYYIYERVNKAIKEMKDLTVFQEIDF